MAIIVFSCKVLQFYMDSNVISQIMSQIPSKNRAYSLEQGISLGDNCWSLTLDARIHSFIPTEVFGLKNLVVLSAKGIPCSVLPQEISQLSNLKVLNLLDCGVQELPDSIVQLPLEILWFSEGEWSEIPDLIFELPLLKSLMIENYGLKKMNAQIEHCSLLEEVSFSSNLLKKIPKSFFKASHLKILDFSNNRIIELNEDIGNCIDIRTINLSNNSLTSIPESIGELSRLYYLNYSNNKITSIPNSLSKCHLLSYLDLNNNQIAEIPSEIYSSPISYLDISRNNIKKIDASIYNCKRLRQFNISNNQISNLPLEINQLKQLEEINFNKNKLTEFPNGIFGLDNIKKIKGWNKLLNSDKRKYIIPFIQSCKKNKTEFKKRINLFDLFNKKEELNKRELIELINSNFRPFKAKAFQSISEKEISLLNIENIFLLGKFKPNKTTYYKQLIKNEILISNEHSDKNSHIVLGSGKYDVILDTNWNGTFITEEKLAKHLNIKEKKEDFIFSKTAIDNIKNLLSSSKNNQELALQLLKGKNIPDELITIIYFTMISSEDNSMRIKSRNLIKNKLTDNILKYSKKDFEKEYRIEFISNEFKKYDVLNIKELNYLLFNKNNKGWLFIHNNYDTFIFNKFKGEKINLSFANLNKLPKELNSINHKKEINLSNNNLKEITATDINILEKFSQINLSNNPLIFISEEILQLPQLRILNLNNCPQIDISKKASWITVFK